jgi:shikimate dehydrogenase
MNISSTFYKLGVCGNPIDHSKGPALFSQFFEKKSLLGSYKAFEINNPCEILPLMKDFNLTGLNITAPFKEDLIDFVDELDDISKQIKALNTVVFRNNKFIGYNTDPYGIIESLKSYGAHKLNNALIVGAGGASRAAISALKKLKTNITITNRTVKKAEKLKQEFSINHINYNAIRNYIHSFELIICTLPDPSLFPAINNISKNTFFLDANYKSNGSFIKNLKIKPLYIPGKLWLYHQARQAFNHFTSKDAPFLNNIELDKIFG